ncbi:MAG: hypothetical protein K0S61_4049, partial [Anaerocolumna sp.]|nr:hypothetical protein [Anaerocolumna sp.]
MNTDKDVSKADSMANQLDVDKLTVSATEVNNSWNNCGRPNPCPPPCPPPKPPCHPGPPGP